jgi:hypothetical protein
MTQPSDDFPFGLNANSDAQSLFEDAPERAFSGINREETTDAHG